MVKNIYLSGERYVSMEKPNDWRDIPVQAVEVIYESFLLELVSQGTVSRDQILK